jgi:hypothetical protein
MNKVGSGVAQMATRTKVFFPNWCVIVFLSAQCAFFPQSFDVQENVVMVQIDIIVWWFYAEVR